MSIWSSINEHGNIEGASATPGADPLTLDVAVAPGWGDRIRLAGWNEEEDFEVHLTGGAAVRLMAKLTTAIEKIGTGALSVADGSALAAARPAGVDNRPEAPIAELPPAAEELPLVATTENGYVDFKKDPDAPKAPPTRLFHVCDILSLTTGVMLSPRGMRGVGELLDYLTGESLFTHQLPRAGEVGAAWLRECFPDLAAYEYPPIRTSDEIADETARIEREYGTLRDVSPLPPGRYEAKGPISELIELMPDKPIVTVVVP